MAGENKMQADIRELADEICGCIETLVHMLIHAKNIMIQLPVVLHPKGSSGGAFCRCQLLQVKSENDQKILEE